VLPPKQFWRNFFFLSSIWPTGLPKIALILTPLFKGAICIRYYIYTFILCICLVLCIIIIEVEI
jgi:hypothetical protein